VKLGNVTLGTLGELHPKAARALDAPAGIFLFHLSFEALKRAATLVPVAKKLSDFPSVFRDLAVVVPVELASEKVRAVILEVGKPLVAEASVFDVYTGPQVGEGRKNLAYALTYAAADRTLTDAEVTQAHQKIVAEVTKRLGGELRG
jgi:phenylalanyl-tRNA synthetase beta chain